MNFTQMGIKKDALWARILELAPTVMPELSLYITSYLLLYATCNHNACLATTGHCSSPCSLSGSKKQSAWFIPMNTSHVTDENWWRQSGLYWSGQQVQWFISIIDTAMILKNHCLIDNARKGNVTDESSGKKNGPICKHVISWIPVPTRFTV